VEGLREVELKGIVILRWDLDFIICQEEKMRDS
jgi:hypothetical protein